MALTLAQLEAMREALIRARSSGVLTVRHENGRTVTYRSVDEINAALAGLENDIAEASGTPAKPLVRRYATRTGW